jgi:Restriction endonuclease S subunits
MTPEIKHRIGQIRRGEVPEGYVKKRKVVIPQQWGLPQIKDIASISSGSTPNRNNSEYWNGNIAWVTTGELSSGHVNHTSELITVKAVKETKMRIYPQGTLLMAMYGQGKTRGTVAILEIDAAVNQACAAITVKDGKSKFLFYQLKNSYQDIRKLSNTGNQENLNADIIKTYQVPWAPDEEQERISTILTTQDKVIELKEKQLTGKQRQKKYLMQQLLTGKKRLPGFAFEVEKTNIKAISTYSVSTISQTMLESYEGKQLYPVFNANSIAGHVDFYENECPYISIIKDGAGIGRVRLCEAKSSTIGTMGCIHARKGISIIFLYYLLEQVDFNKYSNGSTIPHLYYKDYSCEKVRIPDIKEQAAIAEVLSTADREIELLQQDIEQEKQKKKALMQLLLMGIVRVKI